MDAEKAQAAFDPADDVLSCRFDGCNGGKFASVIGKAGLDKPGAGSRDATGTQLRHGEPIPRRPFDSTPNIEPVGNGERLRYAPEMGCLSKIENDE